MNAATRCPAAANANQHIANRLRELRKLRGLSQEKLSEAIGVTFQQLQKYEKGANRIAAGVLYQLAETLNVPVSYFFDGLSDVAKESAPVLDADALKLVRAWSAIPDANVRAGILALCRTTSAESVGDAGR